MAMTRLRGFAFDDGRARQRVAFRSGDSGREQFLLHVGDRIAIFGVHIADRTELQRAADAVQQHVVIDHQRALVGHEVLEAVHAVLARQGAHLVGHLIGPRGYRDMKPVVGGGLFRLGRARRARPPAANCRGAE